ncbi:helix-turn-helix transcriptional regulator [Nocardioides sp. zg-1308]|nr:LuxR C-terminal-related transcriptional regulator [Nocardioides sp. zg-1308]NPD03652.1 helix-turn-helix transcriptional regulator [Nocardioides sp. zg-1308]
MGGSAPDGPARAARTPDDVVTAWVVSPHLLVAQAVSAALASADVPVEVHAWESVVEEARAAADGGGTRHVVAIFDEPDSLTAVEMISALVAVGDVRVAVVAAAPAAVWWGGLLEGAAVDIVTRTTSVSQLVEVVERLTAGDPLMEPERRTAVRAAWAKALDRRQELISLMRTLSPQQLRVLELLAAGHRAREVAGIMGVTVGTVRSHVKALRAKLGAKTQLEAVAMLRRVYEVGAGDLLPRPREAPGEGTSHGAPGRPSGAAPADTGAPRARR